MSVKRHTVYNLAGSIAPMFISVVTVPIFLHLIGDERYGVLAMVWLFLGYFGLFDPGITRAASYHIARLHAPEQDKERESVFWTALAVNTAFGVVGGLVVYLVARPLFMSTFKMPEAMRGEVLRSLPWLAASVTVSIVTGVLGGALQAREKFGFLNSVRIINVMLTQLVPLAVAYWHGPDLTWLIPAVLLARMAGVIPNFVEIARVLPLGAGGGFDRTKVRTLFSYGGWVTITNVLTPILTTMDRLLIGSVLSAEALAFYTVPFNLAARVSVIPGAVSNSIFPKLSRAGKEDSARLASDALTALAAIMTPLCVLAIAALPIFMRFWVGRSFAVHAAPVGVIALLGIWANGLAYIPANHLQASDRPDVLAKLHMIEVLPFLGVLWLFLHYFGLVGAAWAWTLRVTIDAILLFAAAGQAPGWRRVLPGGALLLIAALSAPTVILSVRSFLELPVIAAALLWSWKTSPIVRTTVRRYVIRPAVAPVR